METGGAEALVPQVAAATLAEASEDSEQPEAAAADDPSSANPETDPTGEAAGELGSVGNGEGEEDPGVGLRRQLDELLAARVERQCGALSSCP
eukprot:COSAG01_NODE_3615_length_5864_cov_26.705984_3_plen_93_part_00